MRQASSTCTDPVKTTSPRYSRTVTELTPGALWIRLMSARVFRSDSAPALALARSGKSLPTSSRNRRWSASMSK